MFELLFLKQDHQMTVISSKLLLCKMKKHLEILINVYIYNFCFITPCPAVLGLVAVYYCYYYLLCFDLDSRSNNGPSQQENLISQLTTKNHYISSFYEH